MAANLSLSDEHWRDLIAAAVTAQLQPPEREELVKQALATVLAPARDKWGNRQEGVVEAAFRDAVGSLAAKAVRDALLNNPEVHARVTSLVQRAVLAAFAGEDSVIVDTLATAIGRALRFPESND